MKNLHSFLNLIVVFALAGGLGCAQTRDCRVTLAPEGLFFDMTAQSGEVKVTPSQSDCSWSVAADAAWVRLPSSSGQGEGIVEVSVTANTTGKERTAKLTVGEQTVAVTQRRTKDFFEDVSPEDEYFDAVNLMREKSITAGCSASPPQFCPDATVTLGQMAIFFVRTRLGGEDFSFPSNPYFEDVPPTHRFFKWIQKTHELGITEGCSESAFCPDQPVTRGRLAMFVVRGRLGSGDFEYPQEPAFSDVPPSHDAFRWVQKLDELGIAEGCSENRFCPDDPASRGTTAALLMQGVE